MKKLITLNNLCAAEGNWKEVEISTIKRAPLHEKIFGTYTQEMLDAMSTAIELEGGIIYPPILDQQGNLLDGGLRIEAAFYKEFTHCDALITDKSGEEAELLMIDVNINRNMNNSQLSVIIEYLEKYYRNNKKGKGRTRDLVAKHLGISAGAISNIKQIREAGLLDAVSEGKITMQEALKAAQEKREVLPKNLKPTTPPKTTQIEDGVKPDTKNSEPIENEQASRDQAANPTDHNEEDEHSSPHGKMQPVVVPSDKQKNIGEKEISTSIRDCACPQCGKVFDPTNYFVQNQSQTAA